MPDDAEERERQQLKEKYNRTSKLPSHFRRPVFDAAKTKLSENLERYWTQERCLAQHLLAELRITEECIMLPESHELENCLCFNYFENGTLINTKYRSGRKHFMMVKGAELIPYNIDAILDTPECIITEGEFDTAAFMSAGRKDVISVPAGAQNNLTWMDRFVDTHFEPKQLIYIATDEDNSGRLLQRELVRRLGAERCRLVHFGPECKDANDISSATEPKACSSPWRRPKKSRWKASSPPKTAKMPSARSSKTAFNGALKRAGTIWTRTALSKPDVSW